MLYFTSWVQKTNTIAKALATVMLFVFLRNQVKSIYRKMVVLYCSVQTQMISYSKRKYHKNERLFKRVRSTWFRLVANSSCVRVFGSMHLNSEIVIAWNFDWIKIIKWYIRVRERVLCLSLLSTIFQSYHSGVWMWAEFIRGVHYSDKVYVTFAIRNSYSHFAMKIVYVFQMKLNKFFILLLSI